MAKILAYTSPARGHLFPLTAILDELQQRGHEIALRTLAAEVGLMRSRGFAAEAIDPAIEQIDLDDYLARTPQGAMKRALWVFGRRAEREAPDLERAIDATSPDAVLVDVNTWGAQASAERSGLPWAIWCPYPLPLPSRDAPPFGPGFAPSRGPAGRLRDAALAPLLLRSYERALLPAVNAVRAQLGAPLIRKATEPFEKAPLVLYMTAEPFEYPRSDWPRNVVLVGPCAWEPPVQPPAWLDEIDRPIVLVTTSSEFQDDGQLVAIALEALRDEPVFVVATVPAKSVADFSPPPNARVENFVPHGAILGRAACAVTHGGMGATQKALARGVPVCAVPFGRDQLEVARRVEVCGAGTRLPARRLTVDRMRAKVREAIACRSGAERIAAAFADARGAGAAVDAFERRVLHRQQRSTADPPSDPTPFGVPPPLGDPARDSAAELAADRRHERW